MFSSRYFGTTLREAITGKAQVTRTLNAAIRKTDTGVRIKFSDGRLSWLHKDPSVSEADFLAAVAQWARRHGAQTVNLEPARGKVQHDKPGAR